MAVEQQALQAFQDCEKYALFDASGQVLASNFQVRSLRHWQALGVAWEAHRLTGCVTHPNSDRCRTHTQLDSSELQDLVTLLDDREAAIKQGMRIAGQRYEVCQRGWRRSSSSRSVEHQDVLGAAEEGQQMHLNTFGHCAFAGAPLPPPASLRPHHGVRARCERGCCAVQGGAGRHRQALLWRHHIRVSVLSLFWEAVAEGSRGGLRARPEGQCAGCCD
jgi:hypothetical protein